MSKFTVGDIVRYCVNGRSVDDGWSYKVVLAGLVSNEGAPAVLIEYATTPADRKAYIGRHWICAEMSLVKVPPIHKVTLVTYKPDDHNRTITSYHDKDFTTREEWCKRWPLHRLLDVRELEIELKE